MSIATLIMASLSIKLTIEATLIEAALIYESSLICGCYEVVFVAS